MAGVTGVRVGSYWGTPAVEPSISVTSCLPSQHLPPSLTVLCQSASCRLLIKDNISLMCSPFLRSLPLLLRLLLSALSYLLPSRVRQPGSLPSACLWNLQAEPRYVSGVLKLNAFPLSFISFYSISLLGFGDCCLEHCFPTKQVERCGGHVILLLSTSLLLFCKISTKIPSQLLPRPLSLVASDQWDAADIGATIELKARRKSKGEWTCMTVPFSLKQEALPLCTDPQPSSSHQWQLWCSFHLIPHCHSSLFTSTWGGQHSEIFLLC